MASRFARLWGKGLGGRWVLAGLVLLVPAAGAQLAPDGSGRALEGPERWDIAFKVDVPGLSGGHSPPLVLGEAAFAFTEFRIDPTTLETHEPVIWRIDLATAEVTKWKEFGLPDRYVSALSTDGELLFMARMRSFDAVSPKTGEVVWSAPFPTYEGTVPFGGACAAPAFVEGLIYIACSSSTAPSQGENPVVGVQPVSPEYDFAVAIEAATGAVRWQELRDVEAVTGEEAGRGAPVPGASRSMVGIQTGVHEVVAGEDVVAVSIVDRTTQPPLGQCAESGLPATTTTYLQTVWALDPETGQTLWQFGVPSPAGVPSSADDAASLAAQFEEYARVPAGVLIDGDAVLVKSERLYVLDGQRGCVKRIVAIGDDEESVFANNLLAATSDTIVVGAHVTLFGLDRVTLEEKWSRALLDGTLRPEQRAVLVGDDVVFLTVTSEVNPVPDTSSLSTILNGRVNVYNANSGLFVWSEDLRPFTGVGFMRPLGVAPGLLLVDGSDGPFVAVGRAGASIRLAPRISNVVPDVGETVEVDLLGTVPGALDADFEVKVDWGDGNVTPWSPAGTPQHAYSDRGVWNLTVSAKNDAGQTASMVVALDVGGTQQPPTGFFEVAFANENQERTYFLLGLGVTFLLSVGGLIFPLNKAKARIFGGSAEPAGPRKRRLKKRR